MDELVAWLEAEGLGECRPYLQGVTLYQLVFVSGVPQAIIDEKPKLAKKLKDKIKSYKKSTFSIRTATQPSSSGYLILCPRKLDIYS